VTDLDLNKILLPEFAVFYGTTFD